MTRISLNSHNVALLQVELVHVVIVALAGMLELHLHQVCRIYVSRHVSQPVVGVQLSVLPTYCILAQASAATVLYR